MDFIVVEGLSIPGPIGVYAHEKGIDQELVIDVRIGFSVAAAGASDALAGTIDYDQVAEICRTTVRERHHALIETVAGQIAARVRSLAEGVQHVWVRVAKPGAVPDARTVAVEVSR